MRYLILSDLHANLEALYAVLDSAAGQFDEIICCGDIVGYGPDPNPVAEWVRANAACIVRGNHDRACATLSGIDWFNPLAQEATRWTHGALSEENRAWLIALPRGPAIVEDFQIVHGSPLHEDEYLLTMAEVAEAFAYTECALTFFGHTHVQCGYERTRHRVRRWKQAEVLRPSRIDDTSTYLVNPGSVGQPRDGDPRAGYAIFDRGSRTLLLRRARYDIASAQLKMVAAGLPAALAQRLALGT